MKVLLTIVLAFVFGSFFLTGCDSANSLPQVKIKYHTPSDQRIDFESGCKMFIPCLEIDGSEIVCLDQNVCSGSFDSEQLKDHSDEFDRLQYRREGARYGVDTETIEVKTAADLVYVEWKTLEQGSGLYVDNEYRVFIKGNQAPLISRGIPVAGRWGVNTALSGDVQVISFDSDHLWLKVNSTKFEGSGYKKPLFYLEAKYDAYVATIALQKVVKYTISPQGKVSVLEGNIYYQPQESDNLKEVAEYFHVAEDRLVPEDGLIEIPLEPKVAEKVFAPVYDGTVRCLYYDVLDLD